MQGNNKVTNPLFFYTDVDKISDVLMHLGKDITLRFNVRLASKSGDGSRRFNVSEVKYDVNKYSDTHTAVNIRRDIDFYFSLEHSNDLSRGVMLTIPDILNFKEFVPACINWWFGNSGGGAFTAPTADGTFKIKEDCEKYITFPLSSSNKFLAFKPIVLTDNFGFCKKGLRICINDVENYADIDSDRFRTFYYLLTNTDMYACACDLINFAKIQPYGATMLDKSTGYNSAL